MNEREREYVKSLCPMLNNQELALAYLEIAYEGAKYEQRKNDETGRERNSCSGEERICCLSEDGKKDGSREAL